MSKQFEAAVVPLLERIASAFEEIDDTLLNILEVSRARLHLHQEDVARCRMLLSEQQKESLVLELKDVKEEQMFVAPEEGP
jgi:hypothetical protein